MKQKILIYLITIGVAMAIETPQYNILEKHGKVQIREYQTMAIAVTHVQRPYKTALNEGFRRIANYIFGGNDKEMKIAMTAPVISTQLNRDEETHEVFFVMPRDYHFDSLPNPNLQSVQLEKRKLSRVATITFGGWATKPRVKYFQDKLEQKMLELGLKRNGRIMVAQYNSPWALPPFRKNEIIIQIKK